MLLPHALPAHAAAALPGAMGGAVALPSLALAVEANGSSGTQFVDIFYIIGVVGVAAFGFRAVFDSVFAENTEEWVPPKPRCSIARRRPMPPNSSPCALRSTSRSTNLPESEPELRFLPEQNCSSSAA